MKPSHFVCAFPMFLVCNAAMARGQQTPATQPMATVIHRSPASGAPIPVGYFSTEPPDIELILRGDGARSGRLWIRTIVTGLYIAGHVNGDQPDFPHSKDEILSKDHIEVWLAGTRGFDLPAIAWGDQFEEHALPKGEESCTDLASQHAPQDKVEREKKCRAWAAAQVRYRPYLKRLFVRQWLLAPDLAMESYASAAYDEIVSRFSNLGDKVPEFVKPRGNPQMFLYPERSGYSFGIFIPFDAFPPLPSLRPNELNVLVDVFKAAAPNKKMGAYSTSSSARAYGKPETFNALRLDPPFFFRLTPCDLPLAGTDKREEYHPAWFLPSSDPSQNVSDAFIIVNDAAGYRYEPAGLSPTLRSTHYFWKEAGANEWVCGPHLTYRKAGHSESFPYIVGGDGFETKRLSSGELLVKTGPRVWYSEFGSGQCGGCPRTDLRIFELGKDMKFWGLLMLGDVISGPPLFSQDLTVSSDWSQIVEYNLGSNEEHLPGSWSSTTWCLKPNTKDEPHGHTYEKCGNNKEVQPPNPPVLKELRDLQGLQN